MEEEQNSWMKIINKKAYCYRKDDCVMATFHKIFNGLLF